MSIPKYEDIGKEGNDLLSKGFPANSSVKFTSENSFPEGFELKSTIDRTISSDRKESVSVAFEPTFNYKNFVLKSKVFPKPGREISLEVKDLGTAGSSVTLGTNEKSQNYFGSVGFTNEQVNVNLKVEIPHDTSNDKNKVSLRALGVVNYPKDTLWGVDATIARPIGSSEYTPTVNGRINFLGSNTILFFENLLASQNKPHSLGLLWTQRLSDNVKVATKYTATTDLTAVPTLEAVIETKGTDGSVLKTKATVAKKDKSEQDLKFGLSYTQKLSSRFTYTLGADFSAREFFGAQGNDAFSLGFELKFK